MRLNQDICRASSMEELFLCRMNVYLLYKCNDEMSSDPVIDDTLVLSLFSELVRICFSDMFDLIARCSRTRPGGPCVYSCLQITAKIPDLGRATFESPRMMQSSFDPSMFWLVPDKGGLNQGGNCVHLNSFKRLAVNLPKVKLKQRMKHQVHSNRYGVSENLP